MDKNTIRLEVKKRIEDIPEAEKERESKGVSGNLITLLGEEAFTTLVSYDPMSDEVDIREVNEWAKNSEKKVIIFDQKLTEVPTFDDAQIICIVPGRAFTKNGKRLGRGIGFYDRLLEENAQMTAIGVCFSAQIFDDLPEDTWDQRVAKVVFEGNILE